MTELIANGFDDVTNLSLKDSGVLSVVLFFLQRCEHECLDAVVNTNIKSNVQSPSIWIRVLQQAVSREESCRVQVAKNIGPLVSCMCNDTKRLFFKSNKHWGEGIMSFVRLIYNLVYLGDKKAEVIESLFEYEGLLNSIVQWQFWGEEHRPDIAMELGMVQNDLCQDIAELAEIVTADLIHYSTKFDDSELLTTIGTIPIINKEYDPNCMVSFVEGFICHLKTAERDDGVNILNSLIGDADCVDKGVITGMIDLGLNFIDDYNDYNKAKFVIGKSMGMVQHWISADDNEAEQSDTRVALAIRVGLIKMCLNFIERFHEHEFFWESEDDSTTCLFDRIMYIFSVHIHKVSLHKKTAKAIRHKKSEIITDLVRLEKNKDITNNPDCKKLVGMARSLLDINGLYCCRCNKSLTRSEVKLCNGCGCIAYCSRACQREDWLNGHKHACCMSYTDATAGQFQGRYEPNVPENERAASKLKELELNVSMIQLKLFLDNTEDILTQVKGLNIPIHDCVVCFDLCQCPPTVRVEGYRENFYTPEAVMGFKRSRLKENITCDFYSHIVNGELDEDGDTPRLIMQRMFPHEWLTNKKS